MVGTLNGNKNKRKEMIKLFKLALKQGKYSSQALTKIKAFPRTKPKL
jgi:hypothetical protein